MCIFQFSVTVRAPGSSACHPGPRRPPRRRPRPPVCMCVYVFFVCLRRRRDEQFPARSPICKNTDKSDNLKNKQQFKVKHH